MKRVTDEQVEAARVKLGAALRAEMERQGLTIADLFDQAAMANQQVQFVRKGKRKYSIDSFLRMWLALGLKLPDPKKHRR